MHTPGSSVNLGSFILSYGHLIQSELLEFTHSMQLALHGWHAPVVVLKKPG